MSFGEKMRAIRENKGIGLRKLAKELGVSPSFVSQIEKNKAQPSIDTLKRITSTLGITIADLIDESNGAATTVTRTVLTKNRFEQDKLAGITIKKLVPENIDNSMEPCLLVIPPNSASTGDLTHPHGEEFILVLSGQVEMTMNDKKYVLQEGDNIYFNATMKHSFRNLGQQAAKILWVKGS